MGASTSLKIDEMALPPTVALAASALAKRLEAGDRAEEVIVELAELGQIRQKGLEDHRTNGAVFTPYSVAEELVGEVGINARDIVCDPSVGPGVFLLAVAEHKFQQGEAVPSIIESLRGIDIDPVTVEVARITLQLWALWRGEEWLTVDHLIVGDALLDIPADWFGGCDVVIGNPPFLGQLKSETVRNPIRAQTLKEKFGNRYTAYLDESMLFLLLGVELTGERGTVALILPASLLGSDSSRLAREWIDSTLPLRDLWVGGRSVFEVAAVEVVAPILREAQSRDCRVVSYESKKAIQVPAVSDGQWSRLLAALNGTPVVHLSNQVILSDHASVTADFRDAYYWLAERVTESDREDVRPRLATVGLIDPFRFMHGQVQTRFAKQKFDYPVIDIEGDPPPKLSKWLEQKLEPKLLVATQTQIVECYADPEGELLPSTPLLSVLPVEETQLWHLMAAVSSPAASAWLSCIAAGTGLSQTTIRIRASMLADLPLPLPSKSWDEGAYLARKIQEETVDEQTCIRFGEVMNQAYNAPSEALLRWWMEQLRKKQP
ncbi:MAG: hypothetical protein CL458_11940 [Acidimicrobiaceae bacterium]|nr:hypothetical protein [Acidimicrobiaceae bacterium]